MTTATEYQEYARECARWAAEAKTEDQREAFLQLAQHWMQAALVPSVRNTKNTDVGNKALWDEERKRPLGL
jgi:hypothetical protein